MAALGVDASRSEADELFDEFDIDGGGSIEYNELNKLLCHLSQSGLCGSGLQGRLSRTVCGFVENLISVS